MKLTTQEQRAQDEAALRLAGLEREGRVSLAEGGPWKPVPNRAVRRSWGVRGTPPLGGAFRRPRTRPIQGLDPASVLRPSSRFERRECRRARARLRTTTYAALVRDHGRGTPYDPTKEPTA